MKKTFILVSLFFGILLQAQQIPHIIPQPVSLLMQNGHFVIDGKTSITSSSKDKEVLAVTRFFGDYVNSISGIKMKTAATKGKAIRFEIGKDETTGEEGYTINVTPNEVKIKANFPKGLFYGVQSLVQTLPVGGGKLVQIPCMVVQDYPRFQWRGMMLDVCRHFFTVDMMKQYIDLLSIYKMNTLHWHLTEDQGWRIEIKKYPKLTEIGSKRNGTIIGNYPGKGNTNTPVEGFYTQEQIKDIVKYASDRFITIIPEIEMPGHSSAAIAAYPELSCFPNERTKFTESLFSEKSRLEAAAGRIKFVQETWGVFEDVYAPTDYTFKFLEDVIDEVVTLFPSKYIHIGGDECPKAAWKRSEFCQQLMKEKGLKDEHELQSYFIQKMEKYINSKGRKIIGWDEILEGGLAPNATVMSWRGEKGGIEAAKMKHDVIMSPNSPLYFDHYQGDPETEPLAIGGFNTLKKVYDYEPIPAELTAEEAKYVLGSQANLWTEYVPTFQQVQYMTLPRMLALSEVLWSSKGKRNWNDFNERLKPHTAGFEQKGLNYSKGNFRVAIKPVNKDNIIFVALETESTDAVIYYTTDGSVPSTSSLKYEKPFAVNQSMTIKAVLVLNGKVMSLKPAEQSFTINKASGKTVKYEKVNCRHYPANGANTLTDGMRGTKDIGKQWHAFSGDDMVATVDFGTSTAVKSISLGCIQNWGQWVFLPASVKFEISQDGINFKEIETIANTVDRNSKDTVIKDFNTKFSETNVKAIRITAKNSGNCPKGSPGEGKPSWVFADEIIVE